MPLLIQDGAASGHALWAEAAITAGTAQGVIVSPFFTPETPRKNHIAGISLAQRVRAVGGSVLFDATTHGALLAGADNWRSYNTWNLWAGSRGDLSHAALRGAHVARVFVHQDALGSPRLVPTVPLDSPTGADADVAIAMAEAGRRIDSGAGQSLAGRRGLWLSGDLDSYVGALAQLKAPAWYITPVRDQGDYPPDMTESAQLAALCRSVHSLSRRSSVFVCHADLFGLPAIAAGANGLGSGWHTKQRICAPSTYQANDPEQIRRQARWMTYGRLLARLHSQESDILVSRDRTRAEHLYPGPVDPDSAATRLHHLGVLQEATSALVSLGPSQSLRVAALRSLYESASTELRSLATSYGRPFRDVVSLQLAGAYESLHQYAEKEGIW